MNHQLILIHYGYLKCRKGADNHPDNGDEDEGHRDDGDNLGGLAGLWFLHQIPDTLLISSTFTHSKVFGVLNLQCVGLLLHLSYQ